MFDVRAARDHRNDHPLIPPRPGKAYVNGLLAGLEALDDDLGEREVAAHIARCGRLDIALGDYCVSGPIHEIREEFEARRGSRRRVIARRETQAVQLSEERRIRRAQQAEAHRIWWEAESERLTALATRQRAAEAEYKAKADAAEIYQTGLKERAAHQAQEVEKKRQRTPAFRKLLAAYRAEMKTWHKRVDVEVMKLREQTPLATDAFVSSMAMQRVEFQGHWRPVAPN